MAGIRYKGQIFSGAAAFGDADHVAYDNTQSGLTATDVQAAVDEVSNAANVSYDNTTSGLTATNVQAAVNETASRADRGLKTIGDASAAHYTDCNNFPNETVFWINNTGTHPYTNAPGTSAYHIFTFRVLSTHGCQLAVSYIGETMHVRTYVDGVWRAWRSITTSA